MEQLYEVSAEAPEDLFDIWRRIAEDSVRLANRIEGEFYQLVASLGRMPGQGHTRKDLTLRQVLFFPMCSFLVVISRMRGPCKSWRCSAVSGISGAYLRSWPDGNLNHRTARTHSLWQLST